MCEWHYKRAKSTLFSRSRCRSNGEPALIALAYLLIAKATAELLAAGREPEDAVRLVRELWKTPGELL